MKSIPLNRQIAACLIALTALFAASEVTAQIYPSKPVKVVVGYAPGGAVDIIARTVGQKLTEVNGQIAVIGGLIQDNQSDPL